MGAVALITCYNGQGELLFGRRNDNGKWTLPGGHANPGEDPRAAAVRELHEETGLHPSSLSYLYEDLLPSGDPIYFFSAHVRGIPHGNFDPDQECEEWKFFDIQDGIPSKIWNNLHGPEGDDNIVRRVFEWEEAPERPEQKRAGESYDKAHDEAKGIEDRERSEDPMEKAESNVFWHGTPSGDLRGGPQGLHVGTRKAAEEALHARIGYPAEGAWDGTREYGKTKLAGYKTLAARGVYPTGFNSSGLPDEDFYPSQMPTFGDGTKMSPAHKPDIFSVKIVGPMSNSTWAPHPDYKANGYMQGAIKRGTPKQGYYYRNVAEDEGSVSAVVPPGGNHLKRISPPMTDEQIKALPSPLDKSAPKLWTSDDWGTAQIYIPSKNHPERTQYDSNYLSAIKEHYGSVTPVKVPLTGLSFRNDIKNKPRYDLYRKMVRAGDRLPPAVVRRTAAGYEVLDGNHKGQAARDEGAKTLDAVEVPSELSKAEDEVSRLLDNPDLKERTLALKLDSVTPRHLQTAALDPHPQVHEAAINHRLFGNEQIMHMMEADKGTDGAYPLAQKLHLLARPDRVRGSHVAALVRNSKSASPVEREGVLDHVVSHPATPEAVVRALYLDPDTGHVHRQKLLANLNAPHDILEHALHTGMLVPSVEADELAKMAVKHPHMSPASVDGLVRTATEKGAPHILEIAQYALRNSVVSPETAERVFSEAKMKPNAESGTMLAALLAGPTDHDGSLVGRAMQELSPDMWQHAVGASKLTGGDFSRLVQHAHGSKNGDLMSQLSSHAMFGPQHMQQLLNKAEVLAKSVDPKHFSSIIRALDPDAHKLVDHEPDLRSHPSGHGAEVEAYKNHVLSSDEKRGPKSASQAGIGSGITRKKVFQYNISGKRNPGKAMVKPYHERVIRRVKSWMKFPIQGWAEMTHQALYHAGGIGDLHQKVHVAEHDMGPGHEKEPALVVHLAPYHRSVLDGSFAAKDENAGDYRKIAMMDFLSNNNDRHSGNLLVNQGTGAPLAVDHSRSFQYISPRSHITGPESGDRFENYHRDTAIDDVFAFQDRDRGRPLYDRQREASNDYDPVFDWWGEVGNNVRKAFHERLDSIKDPEVRGHLKRNFDARADWLDERAKFGIGNYGLDWYNDHVPMYKPGQQTDEEKEQQARQKWYSERPKGTE